MIKLSCVALIGLLAYGAIWPAAKDAAVDAILAHPTQAMIAEGIDPSLAGLLGEFSKIGEALPGGRAAQHAAGVQALEAEPFDRQLQEVFAALILARDTEVAELRSNQPSAASWHDTQVEPTVDAPSSSALDKAKLDALINNNAPFAPAPPPAASAVVATDASIAALQRLVLEQKIALCNGDKAYCK